jgi:tetratricopeptide (TPR) repeat protein
MRIAKFPSIFLSIILFFDLGIKRFISFFVINIIFILRLDNTNEKIIKYNDLILRFNPEFEHSWYRKGLAFARLKNYENAINCYDKAININPSFCDAIINKGNVFTEIGQYEKALKCFDDCLKINPKHFRAMSSKADCYFSFEDYSNAIKILDYILEQYPNSIIALFDKAMCLFRQKSCEKSLDLFNQIVIADIDVNDPLISYLFKKEAENKLKSVKAEAYFFKSSIEWEFDDLDSAIKSKINGLQITSDSAFE